MVASVIRRCSEWHHPSVPSKTRIDRAGAALRQWWIRQSEDPSGPDGAELDRLQSDLDVVWEYRAQFQDPLTRLTANLRYYVAEARWPAAKVGCGAVHQIGGSRSLGVFRLMIDRPSGSS